MYVLPSLLVLRVGREIRFLDVVLDRFISIFYCSKGFLFEIKRVNSILLCHLNDK